ARGIVEAGVSSAARGETLNVARGREVSVKDLATVIARVCERPDLAPIFDEGRQADVRRHRRATEKAASVLEFRASIDLDEGLRRRTAGAKHCGAEVRAEEAQARNW